MADGLVRFEYLGPLRAVRGDAVLELGPAKQRAVLAVLLLAANRAVPPGRIVQAVWQDSPPANGANVVQKYVAGLRRVLEPARAPRSEAEQLTLTSGGYRLSVPPGSTDADVFTGRLEAARRLQAEGRLSEAAATARQALDLWRAEAWSGLTGPVFDDARRRLEAAHGEAAALWSALALDLGHHTTLLSDLTSLVERHPLSEPLRAVQMLTLHRNGRQAEALESYREARVRLLAADRTPGHDLTTLHERILQNDAALLQPNAPTPPSFPTPVPPGAPAVPAAGHEVASAYSPLALQVARPAGPWGRRLRRWSLKVFAFAVPLVTLGFGTAPLFGVLAARRRSRRLALTAVVYGVGTVGSYALVLGTPDDSPWSTVGVLLLLGHLFTPAAHAALIVPAPDPPSTRSTVALLSVQERREQARRLAESSPAIARELGIGRPDLPRAYDDGGLLDLNEVPAEALATVAGINPALAAAIVGARRTWGRYADVGDLVTRGLMRLPLPPEVEQRLIVVRPVDATFGQERA